MIVKYIIYILAAIIISLPVQSQVALSTDGSAPDANTMLDVKSTSRGVKFPRLTTVQRDAIQVTVSDAGMM